jgi:hypothetical protein
MSRKWTAALSRAVLILILPLLGRATAEERKKDIWQPFLSEEEVKKLIDEQVTIMKEEVKKSRQDREKIQGAAILIAVTAQNWKEPKNPRQAVYARDSALRIAKIIGKPKGRVTPRMVNELEEFQNIRGGGGGTKKPIDWEQYLYGLEDVMPVFGRDDSKRDVATKEFMALVSREKTLDNEHMTEKLQFMAYKSALVAEVTKAFSNFSNKARDEKWAEKMRESSLQLARAIKAKKEQNAKTAVLELSKSCIACHEVALGRGSIQELIAFLRADDTFVRASAALALGDYAYEAETSSKSIHLASPAHWKIFGGVSNRRSRL